MCVSARQSGGGRRAHTRSKKSASSRQKKGHTRDATFTRIIKYQYNQSGSCLGARARKEEGERRDVERGGTVQLGGTKMAGQKKAAGPAGHYIKALSAGFLLPALLCRPLGLNKKGERALSRPPPPHTCPANRARARSTHNTRAPRSLLLSIPLSHSLMRALAKLAVKTGAAAAPRGRTLFSHPLPLP